MQPGSYPNIPIEDYHSGPGVSSGQLREYGASPFKFDWIYNKNHPKKTTPDMFLGQLVHMAVLERPLFNSKYIPLSANIEGLNKNSTAYKERYGMAQLEAMEQGKVVLPQTLFDKVMYMAEAVQDYAPSNVLLRDGVFEESLYWIDEETGLLCRCRPDCRRHSSLVIDLKKTTDSEKGPFMQTVSTWKYHIQLAFYLEGASKVLGQLYDRAAIIAVEDQPPYVVRVYELDTGSLDKGRELVRRYLNALAISLKNNFWPRTLSAITDQNEIEMLGLTHWAFYE